MSDRDSLREEMARYVGWIAASKFLDRNISLYIVATGAGAGIQNALWRVPGASKFLVGADFPYARDKINRFARLVPEKYASEDFALDLACAAYQEAMVAGRPDIEPVALAVTASVTSVQAHRGEHRAHIVCMTKDRVLGRTKILPKLPDRPAEEARADDGSTVDLNAMEVLLAATNPDHKENEACVDLAWNARERFFKHPVFRGDWRWPADCLGMPSLFPGAFDPPHRGHDGIARAVEAMGEWEPVFTICADAPHKEPLSVQEMLRRVLALQHRTVLFTRNDPLYIDKARAWPGKSLVIGADALLRMLDPRWGADPREVFQEFWRLNTRLLVFGRTIDGTFVSAEEAIAKVPDDYLGGLQRSILRPVEGRWDVSSTMIRGSQGVTHG